MCRLEADCASRAVSRGWQRLWEVGGCCVAIMPGWGRTREVCWAVVIKECLHLACMSSMLGQED